MLRYVKVGMPDVLTITPVQHTKFGDTARCTSKLDVTRDPFFYFIQNSFDNL